MLYHYNLVAAAGYCQPMGYYNRWQNQNSNYATGWTTRGSIPGTANRFSLLQIIQTSSSAHSVFY
jgi:hypothetical protein